MTDFQRRALTILKDGPLHANQIGERLWPGRRFRSPPGGGPWGGAVAASYQMSKIMHKHGWVQQTLDRSTYALTSKGRKALSQDEAEDK